MSGATGRCLCGALTFRIEGPLTGASVCHCGQCRRQSGHLWASAQAPKAAVTREGPVAWYASSDFARRGFCPTCGSFLFWEAHDEEMTSVALGALDAPTGVRLEKHIFTADKGDYYDLPSDGLPRK